VPFAVPFENIILHIIAVLPGIVDVKIGWGSAFEIDKAFEIEVQLNGVHIGDLQAICNNAVGPAAASYMVKATAHGIPDDVPGN
jgi:hypothetical protein